MAEKYENYTDVIIVGAGIAGINQAYRLQEQAPHLNYTILEGRHEIGGTWSLFKYPGIRSDSDLYTFGFSWRPWSETAAIAPGGVIRSYVTESAQLYGIDQKIQFNSKVNTANYSSKEKIWTLNVEQKGKTVEYKTRFMLLGTGYYDYHTPLKAPIPGIDNFEGTVIHPQFWPEDLDYTNKDVVIIGSGATAVTVLPVMAKTAKSVTMLQRSPGYVVSMPTQDALEKFIYNYFAWAPRFQNFVYRTKWILFSIILTTISSFFPKFVQKQIFKHMEEQLPANVPRDPHFNPKYYPWEQRMCLSPNGDFYEGLRAGKAHVETGVIETVTKDSIQLKSGKQLKPDIIITATGLRLNFAGGIGLSVDGKPFDLPSKFVWRGCMLEDLPNAGVLLGYVDASWTLGVDTAAQMFCRMFNTMKKENVVEVTPRQSAQDKATMKPVNMMRLQSTYVQAAKNHSPKCGVTKSGAWLPRSNFIKDMYNAWYCDQKTSAEWVKA